MRPSSHTPGHSLDRSQRLPVCRSWLARSVFFAWVGAVAPLRAETVLSLPDLQGGAGDTVVVNVSLTNGDAVTALQLDLPLGGQLQYVTGSARLTARAVDHAVSARVVHNDTLRIVTYSGTSSPFTGSSGPVCTLALVLGRVPGTYALTPTDGVAGGQNSTNVLTRSVPGSIVLLAPQIVVSADSLAYTRTIVGNSQDLSFSVANVGTSGLHLDSMVAVPAVAYQVVAGWQADLGPGQTTSATVRFAPPARGSFRAVVQVCSTDPDQPRIDVGLAGPGYRVNELHLDPLSVRSGTDAALVFRINNQEPFTAFQFDLGLPGPASLLPGSARLSARSQGHSVGASVLADGRVRVVGYSANGAPFSGSDGVIGQVGVHVEGLGGWYSISVSGVTIADSGGINVVSDVFGTSLRIAAGDIGSGPQVDFGRVSVLDTGRVELPLGNAGDDTLTITQVVPSDPSTCWVPVPLPLQLPPGTQTTLPVRFHSGTKGTFTGRLLFRSSDPDEDPYVVPFAAVAFTPHTMSVSVARSSQTGRPVLGVSIDNYEPFTAFQADLVLPAGLGLDEAAALLTTRSQGHTLHLRSLGQGRYRLMAFSTVQAPFLGRTGPVAQLPLVGAEGTYPVTLAGVVIGDAASVNLLSGADIIADTVVVAAPDRPPTADAGTDTTIAPGAIVQLDGRASADPDGDALAYHWRAPGAVTLSDSTAPRPTCTAQRAGIYPLVLVVSDGLMDSAPDTIVITVSPPVLTWRVPVVVTPVTGDAALLELGLGQGASEGLDLDLGEAELPPVPPDEGFDARWLAPSPLAGLALDYRGLEAGAAGATWTLQLRVAPAGLPVTLTWDLAAFTGPGTLLLVDGATGGHNIRIDLRTRSSLQLATPGVTLLQVRYSPTVLYEFLYDVPAHWSLVSLPVSVADASLWAVLPSAISLFRFDGGYDAASTLTAGVGYWANMAAATQATVVGSAHADAALVRALPSHWSLVGPGGKPLEVSDLKARYPEVVSVYGYAGGYYEAATMVPGRGYWLNLSSPAEIDLSGRDTPVVRPVDEASAVPAGGMVWAEGSGGAQAIELGVAPDYVSELPPTPPAGAFDARVDVGGGIAALQVPSLDGVWPVRLQGGVVHLRWQVPANSGWSLQIGDTVAPLSGAGQLVVSEGAQVLLRHGASQPLTTALRGAYPNPFNPNTTIHYDLSEAAQVRLQVYAVSGQLVRGLVAAHQEAGTYRVAWDGLDAAGSAVGNGVYLAMFHAGDYRAVTRMVLMK
jgi:hypothetical protein